MSILKLIKRPFLFFMLIHVSFTTYSLNYSNTIQPPIKTLHESERIGTFIKPKDLPKPYDYLLTQPLMTKAIGTYYARTPMIHIVHAQLNQKKQTYYRVITMLIDRNKKRNSVKEAQIKQETKVVELAFITMNFKELPHEVIQNVLHTNTPFGQLLTDARISILNKNRIYFTTRCNKKYMLLLHCSPNSTLYGRMNTIIKADNKKWLARVIEILPNTPSI